MKKIILALALLFNCNFINAQLVAIMEAKEPIEGVCDLNQIYAILPMKDQEEAVCPVSKDSILSRLNSEISFLREHPKFKSKGMINLIVNCKGELVKCEMDIKTKDEELDKQIVTVFKTLGNWKSAKLNDKEVDSSLLYSFKIKNGKFEWNS